MRIEPPSNTPEMSAHKRDFEFSNNGPEKKGINRSEKRVAKLIIPITS